MNGSSIFLKVSSAVPIRFTSCPGLLPHLRFADGVFRHSCVTCAGRRPSLDVPQASVIHVDSESALWCCLLMASKSWRQEMFRDILPTHINTCTCLQHDFGVTAQRMRYLACNLRASSTVPSRSFGSQLGERRRAAFKKMTAEWFGHRLWLTYGSIPVAKEIIERNLKSKVMTTIRAFLLLSSCSCNRLLLRFLSDHFLPVVHMHPFNWLAFWFSCRLLIN